jgi:hypothetical protein
MLAQAAGKIKLYGWRGRSARAKVAKKYVA